MRYVSNNYSKNTLNALNTPPGPHTCTISLIIACKVSLLPRLSVVEDVLDRGASRSVRIVHGETSLCIERGAPAINIRSTHTLKE